MIWNQWVLQASLYFRHIGDYTRGSQARFYIQQETRNKGGVRFLVVRENWGAQRKPTQADAKSANQYSHSTIGYLHVSEYYHPHPASPLEQCAILIKERIA